jgi:hypothetical protein
MTKPRRCTSCLKQLPPTVKGGLCRDCFDHRGLTDWDEYQAGFGDHAGEAEEVGE